MIWLSDRLGDKGDGLVKAGVWFVMIPGLSYIGRPPCLVDYKVVVWGGKHELGFTCVEFDVPLRKLTGDAK